MSGPRCGCRVCGAERDAEFDMLHLELGDGVTYLDRGTPEYREVMARLQRYTTVHEDELRSAERDDEGTVW